MFIVIIRKTQLSFEWSNEDQNLKIVFFAWLILEHSHYNNQGDFLLMYRSDVLNWNACFLVYTQQPLYEIWRVMFWFEELRQYRHITVQKRQKSGISEYTSPGFVVITAVYMSAVKREYHKKYQPKSKSWPLSVLMSIYWHISLIILSFLEIVIVWMLQTKIPH